MTDQRTWDHYKKGKAITLLVVALACLCLGCVLTRTARREISDVASSDERFNGGQQSSSLQVCWTKDCMQTASDLLNAMAPDVDPCVDFYRYACGGWINKSEDKYKKEEYSKGQFVIIEEENEEFLKGITKNKEVQAKYSKIQSIYKALRYYHSCLDMEAITERGGGPLLNLLKRLQLHSVLIGELRDNDFDVTQTSIELSTQLGLEPFVDTRVDNDLRNSSNNAIVLAQATSLSHSLYTLRANTSETRRSISLFIDYMKNMSSLLGAAPEYVDSVDKFVDIEKSIAKLIIPFYAYEKDKLYKKMKIRELIELVAPSKFDWFRYIRGVYGISGLETTQEDDVIIYDLDYMINVTKILNSLSARTLASYLSWRVVDMTYYYLGQEFYDVYGNYSLQEYGSYDPLGKDKSCFINLKHNFGMPLGRIFVEERFSGNSKKLVKEIVENIRQVLVQDLGSVEWMEENSRRAAIEKAKAITENIGFPDYIMDDEKLDDSFSDVVSPDVGYFEAGISLFASQRRRDILQLNKGVDRSRWFVSPIEVNALYNPVSNKVEFPAAMLQFPFYSKRFSRASSYGAIGIVIGHELSHGFDDKGSQYDKNGNHLQWWTKSTVREFNKRAECFVQQYNNLTYHGHQVSGERSLSENMADNVGVEKAFKAYKEWANNNGDEPRLPGAMFSNDQIFFISFARAWCKLVKPKGRMFEMYGRYAPVVYRVNATLQNIPDFAKAFNCPLGSPMNPEKKCKVW